MKAMKMKGVEGICSEAVASANGELDGIFAGVMPQVIFAGCDAKKWHSILGTPVAAKWAKPVSRLISKAADGFNSIAYRDIESISPLLEAACTHGGGGAASMAYAYHSQLGVSAPREKQPLRVIERVPIRVSEGKTAVLFPAVQIESPAACFFFKLY